MPRRWASRFIRCAKTASLPATASASAIEASFPDWTIMPLSNSSTLAGLLGSINIREPIAFQAASDTGGR